MEATQDAERARCSALLVQPAVVSYVYGHDDFASRILDQFAVQEGSLQAQPDRFFCRSACWGHHTVCMFVFPRAGVPTLAAMCAAQGCVLARGPIIRTDLALTASVQFSCADAVSDLLTVPLAAEDAFTIQRRLPNVAGDIIDVPLFMLDAS